ncbi:MAG: ribonuclease J [Proteobacteria bacterium]|nr:ribonuclease J [Pseudomonadota bacterium]
MKKKEKIRAIFATHGHEDHIGAIPFALKAGIRAPIYASHFTSLMVRERLKEMGHENTVALNVMSPGGPITVGDLTITPNTVNHSIIDAMALFIDTPAGKIIHTGDFKIDPSPHFGDVMAWKEFRKAGDDGVLLLLSDSTNVEREENAIQDEAISLRLEEVLRKAKGLTLISMFSSNVGRMANIFNLASRMGKKIALTGRSMEQNVRLAMEHGAISIPKQAFIPIDEIDHYDRNRVLILSTGCQGEPRSALARIARDEHPHVSLTPDDLVILSSSQIPGNEVSISGLINELFRRGPHVLYDAIDDVHTSGHATRPELKKMLDTVRPKYFVPVHGEYRHLVHHADLAMETGVREENIAVIQNGEAFEIGHDGLKIVEEVSELRVLVDGREGVEITKDVLRDRRRLAETGVVFCMIAREKESGKILTKPEIHAKGLINSSFESWLIDEALKVVDQVIQGYRRELRQGVIDPDFAENIRIELRRFFERNIGKKPTVVPMVMDV